jgi:hypothetical protein
MPIQFNCPECDARLLASDGQAGRKMKCFHCGKKIPIPAPEDEAEQAASGGSGWVVGLVALALVAGAVILTVFAWRNYTPPPERPGDKDGAVKDGAVKDKGGDE